MLYVCSMSCVLLIDAGAHCHVIVAGIVVTSCKCESAKQTCYINSIPFSLFLCGCVCISPRCSSYCSRWVFKSCSDVMYWCIGINPFCVGRVMSCLVCVFFLYTGTGALCLCCVLPFFLHVLTSSINRATAVVPLMFCFVSGASYVPLDFCSLLLVMLLLTLFVATAVYVAVFHVVHFCYIRTSRPAVHTTGAQPPAEARETTSDSAAPRSPLTLPQCAEETSPGQGAGARERLENLRRETNPRLAEASAAAGVEGGRREAVGGGGWRGLAGTNMCTRWWPW